MHSAIAKEILKGKFEKTEGGDLYLPGSKVYVGGVFEHWVNDDMSTLQADGNIVVDQGLNHILDSTLSGAAQLSSWYIGIYKNNYTVLSTDSASNIASAASEVVATTDVAETVREIWTDAGASGKAITNSASPASYTANASISVYGAFLISNNTIGGATGTLMAGAKFTAVRNLAATDVLNVTYTFNIADA